MSSPPNSWLIAQLESNPVRVGGWAAPFPQDVELPCFSGGRLASDSGKPTTNTETDAKTVVVSGDFTLDWNLARSRGLQALSRFWEPEACSRLRWQRGGAALLADLIEGVAAQIRDRAAYEIRQPDTPRVRLGRPDRDGRFECAAFSPLDERLTLASSPHPSHAGLPKGHQN